MVMRVLQLVGEIERELHFCFTKGGQSLLDCSVDHSAIKVLTTPNKAWLEQPATRGFVKVFR